MEEYHKIYAPFRRATEGPMRNKLVVGDWASPELEYLADLPWVFTEKIDGTNIRVGWDGHKVTFGGRTDDAQVPTKMFAYLQDKFPEELFEQQFGGNAAVLFGEGYGAGIQSGGKYRPEMSFILFDVKVGPWWLRRFGVLRVADGMGLEVVPPVAECTLNEMIEVISSHQLTSFFGTFKPEGVVGTPKVPMFNRAGERIIVKIKHKDFAQEVEGS